MTRQVVYKYGVDAVGASAQFGVELPVGAEVLSSVKLKGDRFEFWALITIPDRTLVSELPVERREFFVVGTGHEFNATLGRLGYAVHRATSVDDFSGYVWHLFEMCRSEAPAERAVDTPTVGE